MTFESVLGPRYKYDGRETHSLTPVQIAARNDIQKKIKSGYYFFENIGCPICQRHKNVPLSGKDTYGLAIHTVVCEGCGLVYNNPRIAEGCIRNFYSEHYRELDRVLPGVFDYFNLEYGKGEAIFRFLSQNNFLERLRDKTVIDIGCGAGGVLGFFKNQGYDVLGCDLVPKHLEFGKREYGLNLHYGDIKVVKEIKKERNFNVGLVIYEQVFEHLTNPVKELEEVKELLGAGSLLFIGVPGLRNIDNHYRSDFIRYLQLPHLMHFELRTLSNMLSQCGFSRIAGDEYIRSVFEIDKPGQEAKQVVDYREVISFLKGLNRRQRIKAAYQTVRTMCRKTIECLPLPNHTKMAIKNLFKR